MASGERSGRATFGNDDNNAVHRGARDDARSNPDPKESTHATEIRFTEGTTVTVAEQYRDVYERFLAANWQQPCEFIQAREGTQPITINPAYVVSFGSASEAARCDEGGHRAPTPPRRPGL